MAVNRKQITNPVTDGTSQETAVHFQLCVSFRMVRQVVEQGQCIREKSMVLTAVTQVQPLDTKRSRKTDKSLISKILPFAM